MSDEHLCVLCPVYHPAGEPRHPHWPPVCDGCRTRARTTLEAIPEAHDRLWRTGLIPGSGGGEHVSGTRTPPLPTSLDALNLLGPGAAWTHASAAADQTGALPPAVQLDQWCRIWVDEGSPSRHLPVPTVAALVGWQLSQLDWALDHLRSADEWAGDVAKLLRALSAITSPGRGGERAGLCPMVLRDDTRCGTQLRADGYLDYITCGRCGTTWDRREGDWFKLRYQQRMMDYGKEAA